MNINEIANDILKREDTEIAKAFTMVVASLLLSQGIQPIINKSIVEYDENDDINKYILRQEYNVSFDIDTSAHDARIRAEEREKTIDILTEKFIFPLLDELDINLWEHIDYIELAEAWVNVVKNNPYRKVKNHDEARQEDLKKWLAEQLKEQNK